MSRYIDAEWLIKESMPLSFSVQKWVNEVQIMTAPSIDIVRCGECKHFRDTRNDELERTPNSDGWCKRISRWGDVKCVRANDFCSRGERKEKCKKCWYWSEVHKRCENKGGCQFKPYEERRE